MQAPGKTLVHIFFLNLLFKKVNRKKKKVNRVWFFRPSPLLVYLAVVLWNHYGSAVTPSKPFFFFNSSHIPESEAEQNLKLSLSNQAPLVG